MARIPYPDLSESPLVEQVEYIRGERRGRLSNLFAMQLHNAVVGRAWIDLGTAIRYRTALASRARELAICEVARLLDYDFQWRAHAPLAVEAGIAVESLGSLPDWREADGFTAEDRTVLELTDAVTGAAEVPEALFARVTQAFAPAEVMELVSTIGFYGFGARFLKTLQITVDDDPYESTPVESRR